MQPVADPNVKRRSFKLPLVLVVLVVVLVGGYFSIPIFFMQPVKYEGTSMAPTLNDGDRLFISKRLSTVKRGDLVVFLYPQDPSHSFIKRVVGLPGERIDMDSQNRITINGDALVESYVPDGRNETARARWNNVREDVKQISANCYFVMGDNRDASNDSRSFGLVPRSLIYGKVFTRYWPLGETPK